MTNYGDEFPPRSGHTATLIEDKIYIFGGINEEGKEQNDLIIFDINESEFRITEPKGIIPNG